MEQLKSLISVMEALSKDNDLKKYVIIGHENDGSILLKVRFTKRNSNSETDYTKPVSFKRKSDKQSKRDYDRKSNRDQNTPEEGRTTRSKAKIRKEIEQPRLDDSFHSETVPISPEMPVMATDPSDSVNVFLSNSSVCDSPSPPDYKQQLLQNSTTPVRKIYAPTNFRNVIPVNSLFDQDPSDHECDLKDFEDNTTPCLGCHKIRFPRSYCPDQRIYACTFDCENLLFEKHGVECYKTHELIIIQII